MSRHTFTWLSRRMVVTVCAICVMSACADSPTAPTDFFTDTFTGTLFQAGASTHELVVQETGESSVTVVSLAPLTTITIGISVGTPEDGCTAFEENDSVRMGDVLPPFTNAGDVCLRVYDVGNVSPGEPIDYMIDVIHP